MISLLLATLLSAADADSDYEKTLIDWGLKQHQAVIEIEPEGKIVDAIITAREDVFSETDPITWPRIFHGRTRENVVLREVLLKVGEPWSQAKAAETERNLRSLIILAVAKVVPVKSPRGGVVALVVTKDRWSFRANWDYVLVGTVLEYLHVPITEVNLLGQAIEVTVDPELRRDTFLLGQQLIWRRIANSRVLVRETLGLVINRVNRNLEGTYGDAQVALPLITLDQPWGFNVFATWDVRRVRIFRGRNVWELDFREPDGSLKTVPYIYDRRVVDVAALLTRRFGTQIEWKTDLTAGVGGYMRQFAPPPDEPLSEPVRDEFIRTRLPRSEDATYLYARAQFFRARYEKRHDLETFGLTEDYQSGPRLILAVKYALPVFSANHFLELGASLRWRFFLGDDILTLWGAAAARFMSGHWVNKHYAFEVANWSPKFEGGRFVTRVLGEFRSNDLNNNQFILGAGGGLRGTASGSYVGRNMILGNFEYRTRPFAITTLLAGFVLFYDVGTAYNTRPVLTHTVGMGLRVLIPQLNTVVIRLDVGWILGDEAGSEFSADRFSSTFGQVTQLRTDFYDDPL